MLIGISEIETRPFGPAEVNVLDVRAFKSGSGSEGGSRRRELRIRWSRRLRKLQRFEEEGEGKVSRLTKPYCLRRTRLYLLLAIRRYFCRYLIKNRY